MTIMGYKWANALVPPTPIWRAMVIRCYAMLSHMFPYLSCLSMIFTRILGNSPEQPPIRIITLFPCRGLVNPEHDPWKSRPKMVKRDWFAVTWAGSGKAVKAHRRVLCRDGPCFAHVLKPSKWSMATGQALAKDCCCRATCSRWPGKAVAKR